MLLSKIKKFFKRDPKTSENISDILDALAWIKTYRKSGDFNTALIATKELILKNQIGITYYENVLRKVAVLENSNIAKIATNAKEKRKKIDSMLTNLYKELSNLEKLIYEIEKEQISRRTEEEQTAQKIKFKFHSQEIKNILEKKDYSHALSFAKKLVSDFPSES